MAVMSLVSTCMHPAACSYTLARSLSAALLAEPTMGGQDRLILSRQTDLILMHNMSSDGVVNKQAEPVAPAGLAILEQETAVMLQLLGM